MMTNSLTTEVKRVFTQTFTGNIDLLKLCATPYLSLIVFCGLIQLRAHYFFINCLSTFTASLNNLIIALSSISSGALKIL